jgi:adenosylcobyric acid synthase
MSNNSGVTPEGLEMGRAQIAQAEACGLPPQVDMNPILLKPTSEVGSQVVLLGEALSNQTATEYHRSKERLYQTACGALDRLRDRFDAVVMEGAGSCAEVNLAATDFVNFPTVEHAGASAVLVADIDRGGVFAQLVGTLACLPEERRRRIAGFVVNRFRGDAALFEDGIRWIEEKTQKPVFGVVPHYSDIDIHDEDAVVLEGRSQSRFDPASRATVAVVRLPHISNFTDFQPLKNSDDFDLFFLDRPRPLSGVRALILPGSKNTRSDLQWLRETGWAKQIDRYVREGGRVTGICGGYQMMGAAVHDPDGLEGPPGSTPGLGLLPVTTVLAAPKTTTLTRFCWEGDAASGYEIHMGRTSLAGGRPLLSVTARNGEPCRDVDGCVSEDGRLMGTYLHGLFDDRRAAGRWLAAAGLENAAVSGSFGLSARSREYDKLAAHFTRHLDVERLFSAAGL